MFLHIKKTLLMPQPAFYVLYTVYCTPCVLYPVYTKTMFDLL